MEPQFFEGILSLDHLVTAIDGVSLTPVPAKAMPSVDSTFYIGQEDKTNTLFLCRESAQTTLTMIPAIGFEPYTVVSDFIGERPIRKPR